MKIKTSDILIVGFALFAIFFGAGNLIFPPYLGFTSGESWLTAALGFLTSDPFFPILGVLVSIMLGGQANVLGKRIHPKFGTLLAGISILLIGPLFSVPRTGATTHEVFVQSLWPGIPAWVTSLLFFGLTAYLSLNPSKVINHIGKYLTPMILIILALLVTVALFNPSTPSTTSQVTPVFAYGFKEGYQTMDALGASLLASVVMSELHHRGYTDKKMQMKAGALVGLVAFVLLALVYLSLTYAGASVSTYLPNHLNRTTVFSGTVSILLGKFGHLLMGICVALACLTTAIGLTSAFSNFFMNVSKGRLPYQGLTLLAVSVEFIISLIGTEKIIMLAYFILTVIYPIVMILILFSLFDSYIAHRATYIGAVLGAGCIGLMEAFALANPALAKSPIIQFTTSLPLHNYGLEWFFPALGLALLFTIGSVLHKSFFQK